VISTINQERLNSLAIMLTESGDTTKIDFKTVLEIFAEQYLEKCKFICPILAV